MDGWIKKMCYVYIWGNTIEQEKEENPAISHNMDGPWGHYDKWKRSDQEQQILYDLTYMWNLKKTQKKHKTKSRETDS